MKKEHSNSYENYLNFNCLCFSNLKLNRPYKFSIHREIIVLNDRNYLKFLIDTQLKTGD